MYFWYTFLLRAEKCTDQISKCMQNLQTSRGYIFHILQYFATKHHHFTKIKILFLAVLMNIPYLKVCLKGEWSI